MTKILQIFMTAACLCGAVFLAPSNAFAQDGAASKSANSPKKEKRVDYKSPPSPELLELQNQRSSAQNSANRAAPISTAKRQSGTTPAKKREPREMPF